MPEYLPGARLKSVPFLVQLTPPTLVEVVLACFWSRNSGPPCLVPRGHMQAVDILQHPCHHPPIQAWLASQHSASVREPGPAVRQSPQNRRHPIPTPTETPIPRWPDRWTRTGAWDVYTWLPSVTLGWHKGGAVRYFFLLASFSNLLPAPSFSFLQSNPQSSESPFVRRSRLWDRQDRPVPPRALTGSRLV